MLQNMLMTALTPLSATNEINCWDNQPFINKWPEFQRTRNKKSEDISRTIKRKPKRVRTAFTTEQVNFLEDEFSRHPYIDAKKRAVLSQKTKIGERQIKIWFQNRRMKKKRQSSESSSDCDTSSNTSSAIRSSLTEEASLPRCNNAEGISEYQTPSYNIEVSWPVIEDQYQLPQMPTYQNIQYHDEMGVYPTEYYPNTYENNGYGLSENGLDQFYNTPAAWYGYDANGYPNDGFSWLQNA